MWSPLSSLNLYHFLQGCTLYTPIFTIYMTEHTHSLALTCCILAAQEFSTALIEIPSLILCRNRYSLALCTYLRLIGISLWLMNYYWFKQSLWLLFIAPLFDGLGQAFFWNGSSESILHELNCSSQPHSGGAAVERAGILVALCVRSWDFSFERPHPFRLRAETPRPPL